MQNENMGLPRVGRHLPSIPLNFGAFSLLQIIAFVVAAEIPNHKVFDDKNESKVHNFTQTLLILIGFGCLLML